ncbi:MAG: hypothetical protein JXA57_05890 [Armatimonadetes bacterium]|nr:hypothetical protein [Armatimonadota bacterium]
MMVWARLDDKFHTHEKVAELDPTPTMVPLMAAALGLHMLTLSWCSDQLTDGVVPRSQPARLVGGPVDNLIEELLRVGLWERHRRGYVIHDFLDYNPSKAQVEALREAKIEAGRRGGIASGRARSEAAAQARAQADARAGAKAHTQAGAQARPKQTLKQNRSKNEPPNPESRIPETHRPGTPVSDNTEPDVGTHVSPAETASATDAPVENPSDDFAGVDFGDEEAPKTPQKPHPPDRSRSTSAGRKKNARAKRAPPKPSVKELVAVYHDCCPSLPRVQKAEGTRRDRLLRAHTELGEAGLREFFLRVEASDFLSGRKKDWRADLDFILKPQNMQRILEGVHDNRAPTGRLPPNVAAALAIQERCEKEAVRGVSG